MAETTSLLNNKKFLVSIYVTILILVGFLMGILIYLYNDNKDLYSNDYEEYNSIIRDIDSLKNDYSAQLISISTLESTLSDKNPTEEQLTLLIDSHNESINITNQIIFRNERIIELDLKEVDLETSNQEILDLNLSKSKHEVAIKEIDQQIAFIKFSEYLDSGLNCFKKINTDSSSSEIKSSVDACQKYLENAKGAIPVNSEVLPKTFEYLDEIENYWKITIELNVKLEEKNEPEVNKLSEQLNESINRRSNLEVESAQELKDY